MILIALCPLAKIFQRRFSIKDEPKTYTVDDLLAEPDRVFKEENFTMSINRSAGDIAFTYGAPRQIVDPNLALWLSGGEDGTQSDDTDHTGIVQMPFDQATDEALRWYIAQGKALPPDLNDVIVSAREKAKELSKFRVMRQIHRVHSALKRQYALNEEQKLGAYQPSPTEFLSAYVLSSSEIQTAQKRSEITNAFKELMSKTQLSGA